MKRKLPVGNDQFRSVREDEAYYVDKTLLIRDFLEAGDSVSLIIRPRRFGKTLNLTMMRDFFDMTQNSREIFLDLAVMNTDAASQINSRPVIFLSFKDCLGKTAAELKASLNMAFLREYGRYDEILRERKTPEESCVRLFHSDLASLEAQDAPLEKLAFMIENLTRVAYKIYGLAPLLLLDEYDQPVISSVKRGYYGELGDFFLKLYGSALKGNECLWRAFLTGVQRITKESVFSKLNNVRVYSSLDQRYGSYFGLTAEETKKLLKERGLKFGDEVKQAYGGYQFGEEEIYNPWSVLNYADSGNLRNYWVHSSANGLIHKAISDSGRTLISHFDVLIDGGETEVRVYSEASFLELQDEDTLWGLLVHAGYLTVVGRSEQDQDVMRVRIPNDEVASEFYALAQQGPELDRPRPKPELDMPFQGLFSQGREQLKKFFQNPVEEDPS